jgi:glutamyl-Q tRNA(Asp) synthetase
VKSNTATATTGTGSTQGGRGYVGRFAPSPSGELHQGSLYTAVASYLDARAHGGRWIVRIEDLDRPREIAGSAAGILTTLQGFGFDWDGDVVRQSSRAPLYRAALERLTELGRTFECSCSRLQLTEDARYPGKCRSGPLIQGVAMATRLRVDPGPIFFADRVQGRFRQDVAATAGDILLKRRDQIVAYVLAVVVDDAEQGVTHVVRGADLLDNTPRQIHLQQILGLATPLYAHVPVLTEPDGSKLAKSRRSVPAAAGSPVAQLVAIFGLLGLLPPADLAAGSLADVW